jgi:hypothetical protein
VSWKTRPPWRSILKDKRGGAATCRPRRRARTAKKSRRLCPVSTDGEVRRRAPPKEKRWRTPRDRGRRSPVSHKFQRREAPAYPTDGGPMTSPEKVEPARAATERVQIRVTTRSTPHFVQGLDENCDATTI